MVVITSYEEKAEEEAEWDDEVADEEVELLIKLKREGHKFSNADFESCEASLEVGESKANDDERVECKEKPKPSRKREGSTQEKKTRSKFFFFPLRFGFF